MRRSSRIAKKEEEQVQRIAALFAVDTVAAGIERNSHAKRKRKPKTCVTVDDIVQAPSVSFITSTCSSSSSTTDHDSGKIDLTLDSDAEEDEEPLGPRQRTFRNGDFVITPFGLGSIQQIHQRSLQAIELHVSPDDLKALDTVFQFTPLQHGEAGIRVQVKEPNSAIRKQASLQDGDIIEKVNDKPVLCRDDLVNIDSTVRLDVMRQNSKETVFYEVWLHWSHMGARAKKLVEANSERLKLEEQECEGKDGEEKDNKKGKRKKKRKKASRRNASLHQVWAPRAYLHSEDLELASSKVLFSFPVKRKFGCYRTERSMKIDVRADELCRAWPGMYLNDTVIDIWISHVLESVSTQAFDRSYVFHSLFYHWFASCVQQTGSTQVAFQRVCSTTKGVDIFEKDVLFLPVNDGMHWTLALICHPGKLRRAVQLNLERPVQEKTDTLKRKKSNSKTKRPTKRQRFIEQQQNEQHDEQVSAVCVEKMDGGNEQEKQAIHEEESPDAVVEDIPFVIFLDSLRGHRTKAVLGMIRNYLTLEWEARRGELGGKVNAKVLPGFAPSVPRQRNNCDCGVFLLEYFERSIDLQVIDLFTQAKTTSSLRSAFQSLTHGEAWFTEEDIAAKRYDIWKLLHSNNT